MIKVRISVEKDGAEETAESPELLEIPNKEAFRNIIYGCVNACLGSVR